MSENDSTQAVGPSDAPVVPPSEPAPAEPPPQPTPPPADVSLLDMEYRALTPDQLTQREVERKG